MMGTPRGDPAEGRRMVKVSRVGTPGLRGNLGAKLWAEAPVQSRCGPISAPGWSRFNSGSVQVQSQFCLSAASSESPVPPHFSLGPCPTPVQPQLSPSPTPVQPQLSPAQCPVGPWPWVQPLSEPWPWLTPVQSVVRVVFHDRRLQYSEQQQLEGWRWSRPGDRILDIGGCQGLGGTRGGPQGPC